MGWTIACAGCGQSVRAADHHRGKPLQCPVCDRALPPAVPAIPAGPGAARRLLRHAMRRRWLAVGLLATLALATSAAVMVPGMTKRARRAARDGPPATIDLPAAPLAAGGAAPAGLGGRPPRLDRGMGMGPPPPDPLFVPPELEHPVPRPAPGARPALAPVGRLSPWLAAAADTRGQRLLTCDGNGVLRWYDLATLRALGSCRLHRPAYRMAVSARHGALITASSKEGALMVSLTGDTEHAVGDLHSYDLGQLYRQTAGRSASPARTLALDGFVTGLVLAPDDEKAYYTYEVGREAHVEEAGTARLERLRRREIRPGGLTSLSLAPDEPLLYIAGGGRVLSFDPARWRERHTLQVGGVTTGLLAGRDGKVYVADRRERLYVLVVDVARARALARWQTDLEGRGYLLPGPTPDRLLIGASAVLNGCVLELGTGAAKWHRPTVAASATGDRDRLLRGPLFLTPGGDYLLCGSGLAFRLKKDG